MSKTAQQDVNQDDVYDTEISDDDYGFILGPDGKLKSVFLPESLPFKTPKNIARILKVFGITDISNVYNDQTLH
jgi:hypothetical protein